MLEIEGGYKGRFECLSALSVCFNITKEYLKHSVSIHAFTHYKCNFSEFSIITIEQIPKNIRNRYTSLCRKEMHWIFRLNTLHPYGLNEALGNIS